MTKEKKIDKDFKLSSWAIRNKTTIYAIMGVFFFYGISAYFSMARENFPEVKETKIYISTVYPGNTAEDIEKLITDPLEDKVKTVSNVVEVTSTSQEDYSIPRRRPRSEPPFAPLPVACLRPNRPYLTPFVG